jgi:DNA-binding ferritin-like protein
MGNTFKETTMFDFEKQYKDATKQYEELAERIKEVNEFWFTSVFLSAKEFFKQVKTK